MDVYDSAVSMNGVAVTDSRKTGLSGGVTPPLRFLMSWLRGEAHEQTRTSAFKRVMKQAA